MRRVIAALGVGLLLGTGCGDDRGSTGPPGERLPGALDAVLISPAGPEGAVVVELPAAGLGTVTASGGRLFTHQAGERVRVVMLLEVPGEIRFRVQVDDVRAIPRATVVEVADGQNRLRASLEAYRVEFTVVGATP